MIKALKVYISVKLQDISDIYLLKP